MTEPSDERILFLIKSRGAQSAQDIGRQLGMTSVGARKHLAKLAERGLVTFEDRRERVGRPRRAWSLTEQGHGRFPDSHSVLTLELLGSLRSLFGEAGLERLIEDREQATITAYRRELAGCRTLRGRVGRLARLRAREGYMAEVQSTDDGALLLVENHCPICAAARACQGLCRSEQAVFAAALTAGALSVEAALGREMPFDARIHEIRNQRGQVEVAAVLRGLLKGSEIRAIVDPQTYTAFEEFALKERPAADVARELRITENSVFGCKRRVLHRLREILPLMEDAW